MLGNIRLSKCCSNVNLYYINSAIHTVDTNASTDDIRNYISTLTPASFKAKGGNRGQSDLRDDISKALAHTDDNNVSILISDFVFSPGPGVDAHGYLVNQGIGIQLDIAKKLQQYDLAVEVLQLYSQFEGFYYDENNKPVYVSCKRPYYIWIIGNSANIRSLVKSKVVDNIRGHCQNTFIVQNLKNNSSPDYKILYTDKIGSFRLPQGAKGPIESATPSNQPRTMGKFAFSVAVDFSKYVQDTTFFSDRTNYECNSNYSLAAGHVNDTDNVTLRGFTHKLKLTTSDLRKETVNVLVKGRVPSWVTASSSENDQNMKDDTVQQRATFGFKYLIQGLCDAFYQSGNNTITSFKIIIQ